MFERLAKYWRRPVVDSKAETGISHGSQLGHSQYHLR